LREVWGYDAHIDTHTLETHIYRLRSKLSRIMPQHKGLLTEGSGYRFAL
jgi:DNA-binding response OmpR family regulator